MGAHLHLVADAIGIDAGEVERLAADEVEPAAVGKGAEVMRADIRAGSVLALGPARRTYDLLMLDAPYDTGAGSVALDKLGRLGWIGPDSWISIETAEKETVEVAGFEIDATRKVGKAKLTLLRPAV